MMRAGDVIEMRLPMRIWAEPVQDTRPEFASLQVPSFTPAKYMHHEALSPGHDHAAVLMQHAKRCCSVGVFNSIVLQDELKQRLIAR